MRRTSVVGLALALAGLAAGCGAQPFFLGTPVVGAGQVVRSATDLLLVTPVALDQHATGDDRVTVELRVTNLGSSVATVHPIADFGGQDAAGHQLNGDMIMNAAVDPLIPSSYRLVPGDTVDGVIGLPLAAGQALASVWFALPGRAPVSWRVAGPTRLPPPAPAGPAPYPLGHAADLVGRDYPDAPADAAPLTLERLSVTVTSVVDPATPREPTPDRAPDGMRMVAIGVSIHNGGTNAYHPISVITAMDTAGRVYSDQLSSTTAGPDLSTDPIPPGATATGFVTVALPDGVRLGRVEASLQDGGPASVLRWRVAG